MRISCGLNKSTAIRRVSKGNVLVCAPLVIPDMRQKCCFGEGLAVQWPTAMPFEVCRPDNQVFVAAGIWIGLATVLDTIASIFFLFVTPSDGASADARRVSCVSAAIVLLILSILAAIIAIVLTGWHGVRAYNAWQAQTPSDGIGKGAAALVVAISNCLSIGAAIWLLANHTKCADVRVQSMIVFPTLASAVVAMLVSCCVN